MPPVTGIIDIKRRMLQGKGFDTQWFPTASGSLTAPTANSGHFGNSFHVNNVGTGLPGTLISLPLPNTTDDLRAVRAESGVAAVEGFWVGYMYRYGTATLNSTVGNRFTHDSTFTRLRRTRFGVANSNIALVPMIYVTVASSVTQASYTFDYVDQDGNTVTSPTNQLPAAVTNVNGVYNLIMNNEDSSVLDITAVTCSVATTGGTISLYGFEPIAKVVSPGTGMHSYDDMIYGGLRFNELQPATTDSGAVTSTLAVICPSNLSSAVTYINLAGVNNA